MQLRVFDVPLMSFLLGMSFVLSQNKQKQENYFTYLLKRFKRLIIPAWVFLSIFLASIWCFLFISGRTFPYKLPSIISSYAMISGVGYVWIIRIFFTIAIISPLLYLLSKTIDKLIYQVICVYILLSVQWILCIFTDKLSGGMQLLFEQLIPIPFAYSICALIGMWAVNYNKQKMFAFSFFMFAPFLIIGRFTSFLSINDQKYPPTPFLLLYGIGVSLFLLAVISNEAVETKFLNFGLFKWLSRYSLEIYYWHIFPVFMINSISMPIHWIFKLFILMIFSFTVTYIQTKYFPKLFELQFKKKKEVTAQTTS